ncbi:very low complexity large protein [Cryptosporidium hominis]
MVHTTNNEFQDFDKYSSAIAHHTQKTVSRIIKEWYLYTLKQKILLELESYVGNNRKKKIKSKILREWFELSMKQKLNTVKEEYILNKKNQQLLKNSLQYWYKDHYLNKKNEFKIYCHIKKFYFSHLIKQILQLWYSEFIHQRKIQKFQKDKLQKKVFFLWYYEYINILTIRNELEISKKRRLIFGYLQYIHLKKKRKEILKEKSYIIEKNKLNKLFNNWIILLQYSMNKRYTILQWQINLLNNKMLQIIKEWKIIIYKKKQDKFKYQFIKTKYENNIQIFVFNLWYILAQESYREKTMLIISGLSARRQLLMNGFHSFKQYLIHRKQSKILKEKSCLFLANYVLMVFQRNSSNYAKHKIQLQHAKHIFQINNLKIYWKKWFEYINSIRIYKSKSQILINHHNKRILEKTYKIWNYVWFKTITNKMIIDCIQTKTNINIKRKVFYIMIYIFKINHSKFWIILQSLINNKLTLAFEKLRINMLYYKNQEFMENRLGDQILQSIIIKHWRILTFENKKIHYFQSKIIIHRFLLFMNHFKEIKRKHNQLLIKNHNYIQIQVFHIWRIISKKKKNLEIILKNNNIQEISKQIIISTYFKKWYLQYHQKRKILYFINNQENESKKLIFSHWKIYIHKKLIIQNKFQQISKKSNLIIINQFFNLWIFILKKKQELNNNLIQFLKVYQKKRIFNIFQKIKEITIKRKNMRQIFINLFKKLQILIISQVWNKIKHEYLIYKSLHKISDKYIHHIQNKRMKLIFNHWKFVYYQIKKIKHQEKLSQEYYYHLLIHQTFQLWKQSFNNELIKQNIIIENIQNTQQIHFFQKLKQFINLWKFRVYKNKQYQEKYNKIIINIKKNYFYIMIKLFNKINLYKKSILDSIHYEFINSFIFKLQYNRVIEMEQQITITLDISIEMYLNYSRLKKGMELWLKTMINRIQEKNILEKEMKIMEIKMNYFYLRISFQKLYQWKLYINNKYLQIQQFLNSNICRNIIIELRNLSKETKFTIQISDLLYRNFIMRRILNGIIYWKFQSQYQKECRNKYQLLENYINKKLINKIFINWKKECQDYIIYYKFIKSIQLPIKKRVFIIFKGNYIFNKYNYNCIRIFFISWNSLTNKKRILKEKYQNLYQFYILKRLIERVFKEWRIKYYQKLNIYQFYNNIIIKKPMKTIFYYWNNQTIQRLKNEKELTTKIINREKKDYLRMMIIIYKMNKIYYQINFGIIKRIFNIWKKFYMIEKFHRMKLLKQYIIYWRHYSIKRIIYRDKINIFIEERSKRLIEEYYIRMIILYRKRIQIKEKYEYIRNQIRNRNLLKIIQIWKQRFNNRIKKKNDYQYLLIIHNNYILKMSIRIWKERMLKEERYRLIINQEEMKRIYNIKSRILNYWRKIWKPHHYIKISNELIKILNRIIIHNSFHKLLRITFYSYKYNKNEDKNLINMIRMNNNIIINKRIGYSYYMECRCTSNELIRGCLLLKDNKLWIMNILSKIQEIRNNTIYDMLLRMREYIRIRKNYEKGINDLEKNLRRIILSRVWIEMINNIERIWILGRLIIIIRNRREERIKRQVLIRWVNKYNENYRNKCIIEYMRRIYGNTIKIKCYLIWSIKFEIIKKKKRLRERYERYLRVYIIEYTIRRMNEYYLYNKWLIWCKKAYDRIEWVHDFRLKSILFINWRRYSKKQRILRDELYILYNKVKIRKKGYILIEWVNRIRILLRMRNDAENYYLNNIIYRKRFKDCFNIWRGLSLRLRNQKKKIMDYLENKNKNLKITCFKLWRFFIYYRKTRNSRFEKITNIIRLNHLNMMVYRIFYSWKLKMIELRSLKNSIFSFWNSGMGLEMDESGLGVEDDERGGRRGRGVGGRGRGGMGGEMVRGEMVRGEMVRGEMVRGEMVREEIEEGRGEIKERREMNELISPSTFNSPSQYSLEFSVDSLSLKLKEEEDGGGEEDLNNGEKRRKGRVENKDVERKDYGFMSIFSSSGNSSLELVSQRLESKRQDDLRGVVKEREIQGQPKNNYGNSSPSSTREYVNRLLSSSSSSLSVLSNISEKVSIKESPYTNSNTRRSPNSYSKARRSFSPFLQYSVSSSSSSSLQSLSYSDGDLEIDELHSATKLKINRTRKNQNSLDWNSPSLSPQPLPSSLSPPPPVTSSSLHPSLSSSPPPISRQSLSLPRQQSNPSSPSLPPPSLPPPPPQYSSYKSSNSSNNDSMIRNRSNLSSRLPLPFPIPIQQQPQLQMVNQDMKQLYDSNFTSSSSSSSLSYFSSAFSPFSYSKKITEDPNSLLVKLDTDTNQTIKDLPQDPYHISSSSPIFKTIKTDLNNIPNQNLKDGQQIESNLNIKPTHSQNNNIFTSSISSSSSSSFSSQSP